MWIQTHTGQQIDFTSKDHKIVLDDIVHALSMCARFSGHTSRFYSVAEHSIAVAAMVPEEYKLEALLHDASEAYTGDVSTPLKAAIGSAFTDIEESIERAIAKEFNLQYPWPKPVKTADHMALWVEAEYLLSTRPIERWHDRFFPEDSSSIPLSGKGSIMPKHLESIEDVQREFKKQLEKELSKRGWQASSKD